jgi:hypothetical protein
MIPSSACPLRHADPFPAQPESTAITTPSYTTPKDAIERSGSLRFGPGGDRLRRFPLDPAWEIRVCSGKGRRIPRLSRVEAGFFEKSQKTSEYFSPLVT